MRDCVLCLEIARGAVLSGMAGVCLQELAGAATAAPACASSGHAASGGGGDEPLGRERLLALQRWSMQVLGWLRR